MKTSSRIACLVALLAGCHESPPASAPASSPSTATAPATGKAPAATAPSTATEQIARGGKLFAANCAKCHGDAGQGTDDAPPLVGKGALPLDPRPDQKVRKVKFHTAMDIAQFVTKEMPPKESARAKITADDYWAILAFALNANGVKLKEPAGPGNAASIVLHP